jgi:hypothetical protein
MLYIRSIRKHSELDSRAHPMHAALIVILQAGLVLLRSLQFKRAMYHFRQVAMPRVLLCQPKRHILRIATCMLPRRAV